MDQNREISTFFFLTLEVETDQTEVKKKKKTCFLGFYGLKNKILKFRPLPPAASAGPDEGISGT